MLFECLLKQLILISLLFSPLSSPRLSHLRSRTASYDSCSTQSDSYYLPSSAYTPNETSLKFDDDFVGQYESSTLDKIKTIGSRKDIVGENQSFDPGGHSPDNHSIRPKTPFNTNKPKPKLFAEASENIFSVEDELRQELLSTVSKPAKTRPRAATVPELKDLTFNPFDAIKPKRDFEDVGHSLIIREPPEDDHKKKTLLWSNPSPFTSRQQDKPRVVRHVEAPKPKGFSPLAPMQKFKPAGKFYVQSPV